MTLPFSKNRDVPKGEAFCQFITYSSRIAQHNAIKVAQWYSVQEGDATMLRNEIWFGQKTVLLNPDLCRPFGIFFREYPRIAGLAIKFFSPDDKKNMVVWKCVPIRIRYRDYQRNDDPHCRTARTKIFYPPFLILYIRSTSFLSSEFSGRFPSSFGIPKPQTQNRFVATFALLISFTKYRID